MPNRFYIPLFTFLMAMLHTVQAQTPEFSDPVKLGPSVNTSSEELNPILSPDGKKLYFARALYKGNFGGQYAGMDIWMAERTGNSDWSSATNGMGYLNNRDNNAVVGIKADQQVLYLLNSYTTAKGVAFSKKRGDGWSHPEAIEVPGISRNDFVGFYMSPTYDVLLISMKGDKTYGKEDLYVSVKSASGQWGRPVNLGATINTSGYEIAPFLSRDKKRLYFASNGHGGMGDADIFMSERLYESWTVWSKPVNLGDKINSSGFDAYLNIADDSTVVFASNREGKLSDLYQCRVVGVERSSDLALKQSLLEEARNILAELRNEGPKREYFIEFDGRSSEIPEKEKGKLSDLIKDLNYQRYSQINLLSFADKNENSEIQDKRLDKIVNYLKLSGINEDKINVNRSGNMTAEVAGVAQDKYGVLIIVTNPKN